jgi:hypothetical protein
MANKVFFFLTLPLPALLAFVLLKFTADAIITLLIVTILGFLLPIWAYDKWVGDFSYERKIPEELINKDEKVSLGTKLFIGAALGFSILHILYSSFAPAKMGPSSVVMPFPVFSGSVGKVIYWIFFVVFFIFASVAEHVFFNFFVPIEFTEKEGKLALLSGENVGVFDKVLISVFVGLYYFAIIFQISSGIVAPIVYGLLGFAINFYLIGLRVDKKMIVSTLFKVGFAVAVLIYIGYLALSSSKGWARKSPDYYFAGNIANVFSKWTFTPGAATAKLL